MESSLNDALGLLRMFSLDKLLNQDQGGRRLVLLGTIKEKQAIMVFERSPFDTSPEFLKHLTDGTAFGPCELIGANDIYHWYSVQTKPKEDSPSMISRDAKVNIIYPCTAKHISKYSAQGTRTVIESPSIYRQHVRPLMQRNRDQGRLDWVFNILEGRAEQDDIIYRDVDAQDGFLLTPDLNWDRKTITSLHLLALVERRDIWTLRDLRKEHIPWLQHMRRKLLEATTRIYGKDGVAADQLKLYFHYQPTYYHLHVHIVHVAHDAGFSQAVGKAFGLENIIGQLKSLEGDHSAGMSDVTLTYNIGEASEIWTEIFARQKINVAEIDV